MTSLWVFLFIFFYPRIKAFEVEASGFSDSLFPFQLDLVFPLSSGSQHHSLHVVVFDGLWTCLANSHHFSGNIFAETSNFYSLPL